MNSLNPSMFVRAKLTLYSAESGGRTTGIKSGYRPNHIFKYPLSPINHTYIGQITFNEELIQPGETKEVTVEFITGIYNPKIKGSVGVETYIEPGRKWWIHEGSHKVGEAEILAAIND